jgi:hypothetical protein
VPLPETELMTLFSTIGRSNFKSSSSDTLDKMGKRPIALWDVNSLGGFPGFKMRMICATLYYAVSKTELNNWVRNFIPMVGNSLRILPVMRS